MRSIGNIDELRFAPRAAQRRLVLIEGARDWGARVAEALIETLTPSRPIWISDAERSDAIAPAKAQQLLGGECDLLVFDAWNGLDADALGAAAGTLRGGGLLLLLTPVLEQWRQPEPSHASVRTADSAQPQCPTQVVTGATANDAVDPYLASRPGPALDGETEPEGLRDPQDQRPSRFLARCARLLQGSAAVLRPSAWPLSSNADLADRPQPISSPTERGLQPDPPASPGNGPNPSRQTRQAARSESSAGPLDRRQPASAIRPCCSPSIAPAAPDSPDSPAQASEIAIAVRDRLAAEGFSRPPELVDLDPTQAATPDQAEAVDAILHLAGGRARRPLVLSADRGRGKSAALGIGVGRLLCSRGLRVLVTAPRRRAADALFAHADAVGRAQRDGLKGSIDFMAPDALLQQRPTADLLIVDEAAGIAAPLLEQMLRHYGRICFSTTVHGYEGTGRGFEVRFRRVLDQRTPGWRALRLSTPIRWAADDPLERLIGELLLLDAEPASAERVETAVGGPLPQERRRRFAALRFEQPLRDRLAEDDDLLRQLFGLLVQGHYQTRPNDLRMLLDDPGVSVAHLSIDHCVLATALIAREGGLNTELQQPIFDGRRRPRGHLLPQTLSAHAGLREAPALSFARIIRIAVHPNARRLGLGRHLIERLAALSAADGVDLLGASFGATPELLAFWHSCALRPLHLGTHRNAASGAHAAVVLRALSARGQALCDQALARLQHDLPILLSGPLSAVEPTLIEPLLQGLRRPRDRVSARDLQSINAFADEHRTLEASLPALARLSWWSLTSRRDAAEHPCSAAQRALMIRCALQRQGLDQAAAALDLNGRNEVLRRLRQAIAVARTTLK